MLAHLGMAASAAFAQVATNLDNLALMIALVVSVGRGRVVLGYLSAQTIVLFLAIAIAVGAEQTIPGWTGYLGVVPLGLGMFAVWRQWRGVSSDEPSMSAGGTILASTVLFLTMSTDSLAVLAPLFADSLPGFRVSGLVGAIVAAGALGGVAWGLAGQAHPQSRWVRQLERVGPYAMIAVGLYVLANTGTDTI